MSRLLTAHRIITFQSSSLSFPSFKMFPAKRHVAFIGAQHDLCALSDDLAILNRALHLALLPHQQTVGTLPSITSPLILHQAPGGLIHGSGNQSLIHNKAPEFP